MKTGIYVPLVTPFKENGEIDYEVLAKARTVREVQL